MQVRVARHTERLEEAVAFYWDGLGLPEIDRFRDHDGYDGYDGIGAEPVTPANPYWAAHGLTFEDPDGFRVVLVPERRGVLTPSRVRP